MGVVVVKVTSWRHLP